MHHPGVANLSAVQAKFAEISEATDVGQCCVVSLYLGYVDDNHRIQPAQSLITEAPAEPIRSAPAGFQLTAQAGNQPDPRLLSVDGHANSKPNCGENRRVLGRQPANVIRCAHTRRFHGWVITIKWRNLALPLARVHWRRK